jgi:hypothetical protein
VKPRTHAAHGPRALPLQCTAAIIASAPVYRRP